MKDITYKDLAKDLDKSEATLKNWKQKFPILLEYVKIGAFCKHNNLDINKIKKLIEIQDAIKEVDTKQ